ncbi:Craniofacial development protein 1 [Hypsizygus marmoreus]|uniref:SWR1-complex protein 5 n=1 Tax=Hypsizygus marmoreus TaxID=39966 RepID=A0A369K6T2_HYPMA|nr:Craniofacial development protein 1 [Hypsizygus marmoreus]
MSTLDYTHDTDSEDDGDYIPPAQGASESSEDEEPNSKRPRTSESSPQPPEQDEAEKKKARDALWSSFQASIATPPSRSEPEPPKEMVKIEKRYKFAGEDVVEVVDVLKDSPDAKKWPLWRSPEEAAPEAAPEATILDPPPSTASSSAKPPAKRPGPRKPKISLTALPMPSSQKAKKLSTLDKSAMDWQAHLKAAEESGLKDELEANRRGGGYIEKMEFLSRVEERREDVIEASKGSKRRRPL